MKSTHVVMLCVLLVQFLLWTSALLSLPYSASSTLALKVVLWGIPAYLLPRLVDRIEPSEFLLVNRSPRIMWVLISAIFLVAYSIVVTGGRMHAHSPSVFYVVSAVLISPLVEEAAFRGVILQKLTRLMPRLLSNAVTAILFLLYHFPLWTARGQSTSVMACLWVLFFSLWMGYFFHKSKSLWTCVIIHAMQNLVFGVALRGA